MENQHLDYSVIIPVYNSEDTLEELIERLENVFLELQAKKYEIILIDDYSIDASWAVMQKLHHEKPSINIIKLAKNFGQQSATLCGMSYASGEIIVTLDDDLQHRPEDIPKLIECLNCGFDVVMARYDSKKHSLFRNLITMINTTIMYYIFQSPKGLAITSFRMIRKRNVDNILSMKSSYPHIPAFIFKTTPINRISNVTVQHDQRIVGKSGYNLFKLFQIWMNLIINYSAIPLIICGLFGIIVSIFSFIYILWILVNYCLNPEFGVAGWNSLIVSVTFFGGTIMMAITIVGEYLRRILTELSFGMPYVVEKIALNNIEEV